MIWDWRFTWSILPVILQGLVVTLQAVAAGMAIALVLGLFWAICRRSQSRFFSWPASAVVEFVRSTPLLVQLFFVFYVLPDLGLRLPPFTTGVLGLGLHYSCYTAEVYRSGIEGVAKGQWQAARALNLTWPQTYRYVVLPQALPPVVPALGNYLIAMFKDAPLLSVIIVPEMLQQAMSIGKEKFRYLEPLTVVGVIFLLLSLASGFAIGRLERRMKGGWK